MKSDAVCESMVPQRFRVRRSRQDTQDTWTLELELANGMNAFAFAPGQFNMLYAFGVGEVPISISGDPAEATTLTHTIRAVGAVTRSLCSLKRGGAIGVRGPLGAPWPLVDARGKDVLMVAGGIGLAPLRPVIYHLRAHRAQYGSVVLLYGARTPQDLLYAHELAEWRGRFDLDVQVTVDSASDGWRGHVGVVTTLMPRASFDPVHTIAMLCGPEVMMRFTLLELEKRGLSAEQIYLSLERNMQCGIGLCGQCQFGPAFVCKDGPVFRYDRIRDWFGQREI